jgi:hypothetical protein
MGPSVRTPIGDPSSLGENLILLRFVELQSRVYKLLSILKVRDSQFDPSLHEYGTSSQGLSIETTSASAERITAAYARGEGAAAAAEQPRQRRKPLTMAIVLVVDDEFGIAELTDASCADGWQERAGDRSPRL